MMVSGEFGHDPRVVVSDVEQRLQTKYTIELVEALAGQYRELRFVMSEVDVPNLSRWKTPEKVVALAPLFPIKELDTPHSSDIRAGCGLDTVYPEVKSLILRLNLYGYRSDS
jgi:nicotinic acid mononucleotide adenylyltransferase